MGRTAQHDTCEKKKVSEDLDLCDVGLPLMSRSSPVRVYILTSACERNLSGCLTLLLDNKNTAIGIILHNGRDGKQLKAMLPSGKQLYAS